ncbi:MAG: protein translocase subunit SecD [Acidimicrobiia bacterium]
MKRKPGYGWLIALVVLCLGSLAATLTVGGQSPALGLDLQGGISVVLQPKTSATSQQLDQAITIIRRRVDGLGVAEPEITRQGDFIVVSLPGVEDKDRAIALVGQTARLTFRPVCALIPAGLGNDVYRAALDPAQAGQAAACVTPATGASTTTAPTTTAPTASEPPPDTATSDGSEAPGTTTGPDAGASEGPDTAGPPDGNSAPAPLPRAGHTGLAQTDPPTTDEAPAASSEAPDATPTTAPGTTATSAAPPTTVAGAPPCGETGANASDAPNEQPMVAVNPRGGQGGTPLCEVLGPTELEGSAVSSAAASIQSGRWLVVVELKPAGLAGFNKVSTPCFNQSPQCPVGRTAIVLDGIVQSDPAPEAPTFNSTTIQITGDFSNADADNLALALNYGSLPVELEQQRVETVSATLGRDSLRAGLLAGLIGVVAVLVYMILYYRALGLVVVLGLMLWGALNYSIITWLSESQGLALSLAGVTGIIVSVGVTTDSFIVYFERMKDEIKAGRTVRSAADHAFVRSWRTIVAADLASFIGAILLFTLTVGAVRGFAFFLGLSTMLDLFTAYFFKRPMVALMARSRFFTEARWFGLASALGVHDQPARTATPATPAATGLSR